MKQEFLAHFKKSLLRFEYLKKSIDSLDNFSGDDKSIKLFKEYSSLKQVISIYSSYESILKEVDDVKCLLRDGDFDIKTLAQCELDILNCKKDEYEAKISKFFVSEELYENNNVFIELRSASGGDESAVFVEDLLKMYLSFFSTQKWKTEVMSCSYGNCSGYKDIIIRIFGSGVFNKLKHESGIHRVQRVPSTDARGRIHTSTCTVAVLPEVKTVGCIDLNPNDLRIDTYRAAGAGGQHVNMTDSAVRVVHIPTGVVAECQNDRSQHKNKQKALSLLMSRLLLREQSVQKSKLDSHRKALVGSGSRSEKIRTYNYINNRVTDHRINLTLYRLNDVMSGNLSLIIDKFN